MYKHFEVGFFLVFLMIGTSLGFMSPIQLDNIIRSITRKNTIGIGERCDYQKEVERQNINEKLNEAVKNLAGKATDMENLGAALGSIMGMGMGMGGDPNNNPNNPEFKKINDIIEKSLTDLSNMAGQFCNESQHLNCHSNGECGCNDKGDTSHVLKLKYVKEGNKCVLIKDSPCLSPGYYEKEKIANPLFKSRALESPNCISSNPCLTLGTRKECNDGNIEEASKEKMNKLTEGMEELEKMKYSIKNAQNLIETTCVCGKGSINSISSIFIFLFTSFGINRFLY